MRSRIAPSTVALARSDTLPSRLNRRAFAATLGVSVVATLTARAQSVPSPDVPFTSHPLLARASEELRQRNWGRLASLVRDLPPQSACVLLDDLGDATPIDLEIALLERHPVGRTIMGGLLVNWGWRFRGTGSGSTVRPTAFAEFQERLQAAKMQLAVALADDKDDGVAASFLIRTEKGLEDLPAIDSAFALLEQAERRPIAGYAGYADAISAKWYGSQERMRGFARQHVRSLPPSSHALIAQAHVESMFALARSSNPERASRAPSYLVDDFVRSELVDANNAFLAGPPDQDHHANRFAHGQFSYAFMAMGEHELARPHVQALGASPAGPWTLLPDPRLAWESLRRTLGLADL